MTAPDPNGGTSAAESAITAAEAASAKAEAAQRELQQLRALVEQQSRQIEQLRLAITKQNAAPVQADQNAGSSNADRIQQLQGQVAALQQSVANDVVPRVSTLQANTEKDIKDIKRVKLSGDFRLRFDGIARSTDYDPGGAGSVLNLRGRYRARLNFGYTVAPPLEVRLQLASGPINNEVTDNQDFGTLGVKNAIAINQIYAHYTPNSWFEINGGRIPEIFGEGSQYLFDPDLNFNGFSEIFRFGRATAANAVLTTAQYLLTNPNRQQTNPATTLRLRSSGIFGERLKLQGPDTSYGHPYFEATDIYVRWPNEIASAVASGAPPQFVFPAVGISTPAIPGTGNRVIANPNTSQAGILPFVYVSHYHTPELTLGWEKRSTLTTLRGGFSAFGAEARVSRNVGASDERDGAYLRAFVGNSANPGQVKLVYTFKYADADSMIAAFSDDDLGTFENTDVRAHVIAADWKIAKYLNFQNTLFIENPIHVQSTWNGIKLVGAVPAQRTAYRLHTQLLFSF